MNLCQKQTVLNREREHQIMTSAIVIVTNVRLALFIGVILFANACLGHAQEEKMHYAITYIAASAKLKANLPNPGSPNSKPTYTVAINGVSNLPKDAVLNIHVYDYTGKGSTIFNKGETAIVGSTGEFAAIVFPKQGLQLRANLQVYISFFLDQAQPAEVIKRYGKRGEKLSGPQIGGNSGGVYINAITVVTE
jgi:hypothetical protein